MKKIKKILAMVMAMAMVLGMSLTTFAAEAKITINGMDSTEFGVNVKEDEKVVFNYALIIEQDQSQVTGWKFSSKEVEDIYVNAFTEVGEAAPTAQDVIADLIDIEKNRAGDNDKNIAAALNAIKNAGLSTLKVEVKTVKDTNELPVSAVGVYYIDGTQKGYSYNPMTAYVKFGEYNTDGTPGNPVDTAATAKRIKTDITKTSDVNDGVTEIGRTVEYYVESTVPFIPLTDNNRTYMIIDEISGAKYVTEERVINGDNVKVVALTVEYGDQTDESTFYGTLNGEETSFTADLSSLLANNDNANKNLKVTYKAVVTDIKVGNSAYMGDGTNTGKDKFGSSTNENDLYTGWIEVTKYASDEDNDNLSDNVTLEGAEFIIYKTVTEGASQTTKYATFEKNEDDEHLFAGWVDEAEKAVAVATDESGKVKVNGLAEGSYSIKESKAPDGYSLNDEVKTVTLTAEKGTDGKATASFGDDSTFVIDTQLSALPSTGGIGTTIFTIGGVAIMVVAAGLFFATRKKASK